MTIWLHPVGCPHLHSLPRLWRRGACWSPTAGRHLWNLLKELMAIWLSPTFSHYLWKSQEETDFMIWDQRGGLGEDCSNPKFEETDQSSFFCRGILTLKINTIKKMPSVLTRVHFKFGIQVVQIQLSSPGTHGFSFSRKLLTFLHHTSQKNIVRIIHIAESKQTETPENLTRSQALSKKAPCSQSPSGSRAPAGTPRDHLCVEPCPCESQSCVLWRSVQSQCRSHNCGIILLFWNR